MRGDRRVGLVCQRGDAVSVPLLLECLEAEVPDVSGAVGRSLQELRIAQVGGDVRLYETRYVDLFAPKAVDECLVQFHRRYCSF